MKITAIDCKMVHVPYKGHYQTAAGKTKHIRRVLVYVDTDENVRIRRAIDRGGEPDDVRRRAAIQADRDAWLEWADTVIPNNGAEAELRERVDAWWDELVAE